MTVSSASRRGSRRAVSVRAADLASIYEVSIRTIYRDIAALSESGVPIVSLPGRGYSLVDGYFLPPLLLSTREATALVLGARLLAGQTSAEIASAADEAVAKLIAVIGDDARRELRELDEVLDLATSPDLRARLDVGDERVRSLWQAILERRVTTIRYFGRNRSQETVRQVEPMRLGYADGAWYLTAYCRDPPAGARLSPGPDRAPRSGNRPISRSSGNGEPGACNDRGGRSLSRRDQPMGAGAATLVVRR